jgi:hypothetical protein
MDIKKLSREETEYELSVKKLKKTSKPVHFKDEIMGLKSGESLVVPKKEWETINPTAHPSVYYHYYKDVLNIHTRTSGENYLIIKN